MRTRRTSFSSAALIGRSRFSAASATTSANVASLIVGAACGCGAGDDAGIGCRIAASAPDDGMRGADAGIGGLGARDGLRLGGAALPRLAFAAARCAVERADDFVGRRQVGGIGNPHHAPFRRRPQDASRPCTSVMPLSSICHIRDSTRIESFDAKSRPRSRSVSLSALLSAVAGTILTRVTKFTNSARSLNTTAGSAPVSY